MPSDFGIAFHGTSLNATTFKDMDVVDCEDTGVGSATTRQSWVLAYDFETFAKSATESGINVADRALPVSLELRRGELQNASATGRNGIERAAGGAADGNQTIRYDTFAMCDCIIYIDLMGKITTRI